MPFRTALRLALYPTLLSLVAACNNHDCTADDDDNATGKIVDPTLTSMSGAGGTTHAGDNSAATSAGGDAAGNGTGGVQNQSGAGGQLPKPGDGGDGADDDSDDSDDSAGSDDDGNVNDDVTDDDGADDDGADDTDPDDGTAEVLGPTPASASANFPFPQNRFSELCNHPAQISNEDVLAAYELWRRDTVTSDGARGFRRIKRTPSDTTLEPGSTVSEGIAYGMLIAVFMDDQELFDDLWLYSQEFLDSKGLMHWYISADGESVLGTGGATDSDEDIAYSLIMADRQWPNPGKLSDSYYNLAQDMVRKVWEHEILDGKGVAPGDEWGGWDVMNVSYFAPSYYRTFAEFSGNAGWHDVVTTSYDIIYASLKEEYGNLDNGLVPAWCTSEGVPNSGAWQDNSAPTHYQYDSCRTPFRIGIDYCFFGEQRAFDYVAKTSSFFSAIGAANMVDGYELNGDPRPQYEGQSAAFMGPAAVGAMHDAQYAEYLQDAYDRVAGLDLMAGGAYYDQSWTVISLLMMTGNFLDYTLVDPVTQ